MKEAGDTANGILNETQKVVPAQTPAMSCPAVEELTAWLEHDKREASPALTEHLRKCPCCSHLVELADSQEPGAGIDAGLEDQDLLAIQPGLRTPAPPANQKWPATSAKSKTPAAQTPARTWKLLTGRPVRPAKS